MNNYTDDDLLMLSGIQHVAFCPRQWALIHIEQQWAENVLTAEGHYMHQRADNPLVKETSPNKVVVRSVSLVSRKLGLYGMADVVEFVATDSKFNSTTLENHAGYWQPIPIEYKRGQPKPDERDEVQLCAQAMCLEEMYNVRISAGYLFYGETRHRHEVDFHEQLRQMVESYSAQMHQLFKTATTPPPVYKAHCKSCSLVEVCIPKALVAQNSVGNYLKQNLES